MVNDAKRKTGTEHKSLDVHSGGTRDARVFAGSQDPGGRGATEAQETGVS